jgi:hypothetical protein
VKKIIEVPLFSNQTFVYNSQDYEKYYKISENLDLLSIEHKDAYALRIISNVKNLTGLKCLKVLHHPFAFDMVLKNNGAAELS